ncbi:MAG: S8 family serine peptidase, partial [Bryobacteraceae bacterium]|nr:S8 family serine peptidase [Bryobacteraceae bacterium]
MILKRLALILLAALAVLGQEFAPRAAAPVDTGRWIVLLEDPPLAAGLESRAELSSARSLAAWNRISDRQVRLSRELDHLGVRTLASTRVILNALFVRATADQAERIRRIPGVTRVIPAAAGRRFASQALPVVRAPQAWNTAFRGGETAGEGTKIGVIDTGVDQNHPAFSDAGFDEPSGGRLCRQSDGECDYTNKKVFAVRSYVRLLAESGDPQWTRPDDYSPRDRVGHGTAVAMLAGGVIHDSPIGTISGVAPRARIGSYKVFGSPGVNDVTFDFVVMKALEDALADGMDVVTLSLGFPAVFGPNDTVGNGCTGEVPGEPCDPWVRALSNVRRLGMAVVVAAGNEGDLS